MSKLAEYLALAKAHPNLFVNPPGGYTILLDEAEIHAVEAQKMQELKASGFPVDWARVGIVYKDQYGCMLRDAVRFPGGQLGTYIRFITRENAGPGAVVLPLYLRRVLLVRHFRHTTRTWHLENPLRPGMSFLSAEENARRMLIEKIGATISSLTLLGKMDSEPGMVGDCVEFFYFCANVTSYGQVNIHEGITDLLQVTVPEFEEMIHNNEITDGFTIAAYAYARLRGLL